MPSPSLRRGATGAEVPEVPSATSFQTRTVDKGEFIVPIRPFDCRCQRGGVSVGRCGWGPARTSSRFLLVQLFGALLTAQVSFKMPELSKKLELLSCGEAVGKANMLSGTLA